MPDVVYGQHLSMKGATDAVAARMDTRLILANPATGRLVTVSIGGSAPNAANAQIVYQASSDELIAPPRAVAADMGLVFGLGINALYVCTDDVGMDSEDFAVTTFAVDCVNPDWLLVYNGFLYFPLGDGGVQVYTVEGVKVAEYDHVLPAATHAALDLLTDAHRLVVADGFNALAVTLDIQADGTLEANPQFDLVHCKNIVAVVPDTDYLAVACQDRVVIFSLDDRTAPEFTERIRLDNGINDMVRTGSNSWWLATTSYLDSQEDRFNYINNLAVYLAGRGVFAVSSYAGRVIGQADFVATRPTGATDSFLILQEDTFSILTEDGDPLRQE